MENRKIVIVSTRTQKKSVIETNATTLGELKVALDAAGIDYDGMTFYEGTSKTELKANESVLPHDVPYKGTVTNELVFMLTNTNKNIKSGMGERAELFKKIKALGLQEVCIKKFGKNFTQCKSTDLESLISSTKKENIGEETPETASLPTEPKAVSPVDQGARNAILELVEILKDSELIIEEEAEFITDVLYGRNSENKPVIANVDFEDENEEEDEEEEETDDTGSYSESDLDDMFDFIKN